MNRCPPIPSLSRTSDRSAWGLKPLVIIELLQKEGARVSYNDPYFPRVSKGRKYDLQMKCAPLTDLGQYDCVLIATDHSDYDYGRIVQESQLVVDTRNATRGIVSPKIVRC